MEIGTLAKRAVTYAVGAPVAAITGGVRRATGSIGDGVNNSIGSFCRSWTARQEVSRNQLAHQLALNKSMASASYNLVPDMNMDVRMVPNSVGNMQYRKGVLYLTENTFTGKAFQGYLTKFAQEAGLKFDAKKFAIALDGTVPKVSYNGSQAVSLDAFGIDNTTAIAIQNAIKAIVQEHTQQFMAKVIVAHHLKDLVNKNTGTVAYKVDGKTKTMSIDTIANAINGNKELPKGDLEALSFLLTSKNTNIEDIKEQVINGDLKGIASEHEAGVKVINKIYVSSSVRDPFSFEAQKPDITSQTEPSTETQTAENTTTTPSVIPSIVSATATAAPTFTTTPTQDAQALMKSFVGDINQLITIEDLTDKFNFVSTFIADAGPTFSSTQPFLFASMVQAKTQISAKIKTIQMQVSAQQAETETASANTTGFNSVVEPINANYEIKEGGL